MIVGHNHHRLEKRIAAVLLSGVPYLREACFLQQMSRRILQKGNNAFLTDRQAAWLFTILARCEKQTSPPNRPAPALSLHDAQPKPEGREPFNIEKCFVNPQSPAQHPPTRPDPIVPSTPHAQAPEPAGTREADIGNIFRRVIARNENLRKRRTRIEQQRLESTSPTSSRHSPPEFTRK